VVSSHHRPIDRVNLPDRRWRRLPEPCMPVTIGTAPRGGASEQMLCSDAPPGGR